RIGIAYTASAICRLFTIFFFFDGASTTEIYTLSLHDALPIYVGPSVLAGLIRGYPSRQLEAILAQLVRYLSHPRLAVRQLAALRSEEHTSELQSRGHLVCRLLLEKKKKKHLNIINLAPTKAII